MVALKENLCIFTNENREHIFHKTGWEGVSVYQFKWVRGEHIEVFLDGIFQFSADSMSEVFEELQGGGQE